MAVFSKPSALNALKDEVAHGDDFDFALLLAAVGAAHSELVNLGAAYHDLLEIVAKEEKDRKYYEKKRARTAPSVSKFPSWSEIRDEVSDKIFRKKYRMTKSQFELLCSKIKAKIGEKRFRVANGQGLCGEIRIAIGLRLLCGGSYLDLLGRAYGVESPKSIYKYFDTLLDWIEETFDFPLVALLRGLKNGDDEAFMSERYLLTYFPPTYLSRFNKLC